MKQSGLGAFTALVLGFSMMVARAEQGAEVPERTPDGRVLDWCRTLDPRAGVVGGSAGDDCPIDGVCDIASNRDGNVPTPDQPFMTIRLKLHIFANNDGSGALSTIPEAMAQIETLNENYAPLRVRFAAEYEINNSTQFRNYDQSEDVAMKNAFADDPQHYLNIYIVNNAGFAFGTFPWNPIALTNLGGIVIAASLFGPNGQILAHEVGHCLGLWHTHHGVSEVFDCSPCYEYADGSNGNTAGDFCGDTAPTPVNFGCSNPGGVDCTGTQWGETDFRNYMGYAPPGCYTNFSVQQWGRMHCWVRHSVYSWVVDCNGNGADDEADVAGGFSLDCNGNLNPDECELDCNGNDIPDECDFAGGGFPDCDANGNPDECDSNFDGDELIDACDDDVDNDGVNNDSDPCDFTPVGAPIVPSGAPLCDTDADCDVDLVDFKRFRAPCLVNGGPGIVASAFCQDFFDADDDTNIDLFDFAGLAIGYTGAQ